MKLSIAFPQAITVLLALATCTRLDAGITRVWSLGDGEKVYRYQQDHPSKHGNRVWDGECITLRGLRNEVLAFQVIVEADSLGAGAVEVSVSPPVHRPSGAVIGGASPVDYGPGGTIEVFSQHYVRVKNPTRPLWFYVSEAAAPEKMIGWIPDALVPAAALPGRGGMPLDMPPTRREVVRHQNTLEINKRPALQNQGFWVDLYLPRDRAWSAGTYSSAVRVFSEGELVEEIPLRIELLDLYLPDENHTRTWVFNSDISDYFPGLPEERVERMLKFTAHRHRLELVGGFDAHRRPFDSEMMERYKPYLDGSAFTASNGYHGPGAGEGETLFPVGMYGGLTNSAFGTMEKARRESDRWVRWFEENAPHVRYFWYMIDEPGEVQFPWIRERASWVHDNPGPGSRLPVFTTREYTPALDEAIDVWAGYHGVDLEMLPELQRRGGDHWFYNGARPHYGSEMIESAAVDYRVNAWVKYIYKVNTWFLWESTHWTHNHQGPKGHLHQRVFSDPVTFINWGDEFGNGAGVLFYPGRMPYYPDEDRGLDCLLGSIRLKNIRRGHQDYEIMWLAERKLGRPAVLELVRQVVPRALSETPADGPVPWSGHGVDYDRVIARLVDLLAS